jgi:hypothetical protein
MAQVTEAQAKAREVWAERKAAKLETALQRKAEREKRSPQEQLDLLDKRLGKDQGAARERARLQAMLDAPPKPAKKRRKKGKRNAKA